MNKEQWDSLKEGDKVVVKSLSKIISLSDKVDGGYVAEKYSDVNNVFEVFFFGDMKCYCENVYEVEAFSYTIEGIKATAELRNEDAVWNFIPDWLEKVVD